MTYALVWRPEADAAMDALEADPSMSDVVEAIDRTLDRLEADPFDPRLGTTGFVTEEYGGVSATPARLDNWFVLWRRGTKSRTIEIILIHPLSL